VDQKVVFEIQSSVPTKVLVFSHAGRRSKFAPVQSLRFSELILGIFLSEFRFTVFLALGSEVDSSIPPLQFFQTAKGNAPKEA